MKRTIASAAFAILAVACATAPMTSSSSDASTGDAAAIAKTTDYVLLSSPTSVRAWDATDPEIALHVRGTMTSNGFVPVGGVQGRGKLCSGTDWISFSDLKIHKASEGTPKAPYLLGCASGSTFVPASREVVTQE